MHLPYITSSYTLYAYDPLTVVLCICHHFLYSMICNQYPPYYNPSGLILNSLSFIKFSFYVFILNPIFWI